MSNWFKKSQEEWEHWTEQDKPVRYMGTVLAEVRVLPGEGEYDSVASKLAELAARAEREEGIKLTPQGDYQRAS